MLRSTVGILTGLLLLLCFVGYSDTVSQDTCDYAGEWHMVVAGVDLVRSRSQQQPFLQNGSPKSLQVRLDSPVMRRA